MFVEILVLEKLQVKTRCRNVSECKPRPSNVSGIWVSVTSWPGACCEVTVLSLALYAQQGGHKWTPVPFLCKIRKIRDVQLIPLFNCQTGQGPMNHPPHGLIARLEFASPDLAQCSLL